MPFASKPNCTECKATNSTLWKKTRSGDVVCNPCYHGNGPKPASKEGTVTDSGPGSAPGPIQSHSQQSQQSPSQPQPTMMTRREASLNAGSQFVGPIRKSARLKPSKYKTGQPVVKPLSTKGRGRRIIFKKNPIKAPSSVATVVTSNHIFYEGQYWQIGDIASVIDHDGAVYYVQIRGFLQDQYCEKSAVISWLLPTQSSLGRHFDPSTYILGPEEDLPRTMDSFEFVCHAPSEYFKSKTTPYFTKSHQPEICYVATSLGGYPVVQKLPTSDEIYGLNEEKSTTPTGRRERKREKKDVKKEKKKPVKSRTKVEVVEG